jgi:glycine betaine catabolism B
MLKLKSVNFSHQLFQEYVLEPEKEQEWIIGRDPRCHLVLTTLDVSRTHGRIFFEDASYYFENISQHGTTLNSNELLPNEKLPICKGDLLVLGETYLHVEELAGPEELPPMEEQLNVLWTADEVCCCRVTDETSDVKTFHFATDPPTLFRYQPGQFINLELEIDGKTVIRPYSISSSPTRPHHLAITVKRLPGRRADLPPGLVSNWMHDRLKVGDRIKLRGEPSGAFTCLPNLPPKILFISAGSGITPMMSMARWIQDTLSSCDVVFLHSARTPEDIIFRRELETMATLPNFRVAFTISRMTAQSNWTGLTGRISEMMLQMVVPDLCDRAVYACGSNEWMQNIKSILTALNFPMEAYQEESFGGYQSTPGKIAHKTAERNGKGHAGLSTSTPTKPPEISFTQSRLHTPTDGDLSILELAEQEGVLIPNACRAGVCGACKVRTEGQVRYATPPTALTATDREAGYALACVAHPVGALTVDA